MRWNSKGAIGAILIPYITCSDVWASLNSNWNESQGTHCREFRGSGAGKNMANEREFRAAQLAVILLRATRNLELCNQSQTYSLSSSHHQLTAVLYNPFRDD